MQDPDLDSLRLRNLLQGYHWLELARQSCMASGSATRWFRAWHSFPERELLPFRPLLQQRRLDGKPPVQGLLERDSLSGSRSSVLCSDVGLSPPLCRTLPRPDRACGGGRRGRHGAPVAQRRRARRRPVQSQHVVKLGHGELKIYANRERS